MNSENDNNFHTLDDSEVIPTLEFRSDDSRQDVLDLSQLLPESGVNSSNLKQFVKISSSGVFVDSSGAGQFSADDQVARFAAGNPPLNAMVAVQIADTSVIHFDRSVTANDPLVDDLSLEDIDLNELNEVTGTARQDMLVGSASADVLYGARGDDVLEGGAGNDVYIGGAGADRYVLNDPDSFETLDFKSTRFEKDVLDVGQLLPEGVDASNLSTFLKITENGVFIDESGLGDFGEDNLVARFTEESIFSRNEIVVDIGNNIQVVFNVFAQAGVRLEEGESFQSSEILASRTDKYNPRASSFEPDSGPDGNTNTAFLRSREGELFNFRLDEQQVEEAHGYDGDEILDATQVAESSQAKNDDVADHKLWTYGRAGSDTLQGNADGVYLDGGLGNDLIDAGRGRNFVTGGAGQDEYVLQLETTTDDDLRSDLLYDYTSIEGHRDLIDLQHILPLEATAGNIHSYVKVTDVGIYVDVTGAARFDKSNELGRWGERVDIDNLITLRLADGSNIELNRDDALSEFIADENGGLLRGGQGSDILRGQSGDDIMDGDGLSQEKSADHLYGGAGNDQLTVDGLDLASGTVEGGAGYDTARLQGATGDILDLDLKARGIERAFGGFSDDVLDGSGYTGQSGYNRNTGEFEGDSAQRLGLYGKYGDDTLKGGVGNDYLDGGQGDDVIAGGLGKDFLAGGAGNDTFILSDDGEVDTVWDFTSDNDQQDVLDISNFIASDFEPADLSRYFFFDDQFVYFDHSGESHFTPHQVIAKFGGASTLESPVTIYLGEGRSVTRTSGSSLQASDLSSSIQEDSNYLINETDLINAVTGGKRSEMSVSGLSVVSGAGDIIDNQDGTFTFRPGYNLGGTTARLSFTVTDGTNETSGNYAIEIAAVADAPKLLIKAQSVDEVIVPLTDADFSNATGGVVFDATVSDYQSVGGGVIRNVWDVNEITGSAYDDTFKFDNLQAGDVITLNGGAGSNTVDLGNFRSDQVTLDLSTKTATIDVDGTGNTAVINFNNIDLFQFRTDVFDGTPHAVEIDDFPWVISGTDLSIDSDSSGDNFPVTLINYEGAISESFILDAQVKTNMSDSGWYNGGIIFDYQDENNYKFVMARIGAQKWRIEQIVDGVHSGVVSIPATIPKNVYVPIQLRVDGSVANFYSEGELKVSHDFGEPLNDGRIGVLNNNAVTDFILEMSPSNWAPSVENYEFEMQVQDGTLITGNVFDGAEDPANEVLSVSGFSHSANGSVTYNGDGTFSYTPADGFVGADQFSYQITDGTNVTTGTIDVVVSDNASVTLDEGGAFQVDLGVELVDTDGSETLEVTLSGIPEGALVSDGVNSVTLSSSSQVVDISTWDINSLLITPSEHYFGNFNVDVTATSSESGGSTSVSASSLTVYVLPIVDAPVAGDVTIWQVVDSASSGNAINGTDVSNIVAAGEGDDQLNGQPVAQPANNASSLADAGFVITAEQLLANSVDYDGDDLTVQEVTYSGSDGALTNTGVGTWQFEPNDNFSGLAEFSFTVTDGELTNTAAATLNARNGSGSVTGVGGVDVVLGSSAANSISGGAGNDTLIGHDGDDILFGGSGDDRMTGVEGSDTFSWVSSDPGTAALPAEDLITDFQTGPGGDVLDLADLLDEADPLDNYLSLNFKDSDTVLEVRPEASDVTQRITLKGVDLSGYGGGVSDMEIINNLIDDGNLQV